MNLVILEEGDWLGPDRAGLSGRKFQHVQEVHRLREGGELRVGVLGGRMGRGRILQLGQDHLEMEVQLDQDPPPKLPVHLVLALPRPKVLNRVLASATSLGVEAVHLVNAWKVEKSYWKSPRMAEENLRMQRLLGLEQARDTILPELHLHRLFRAFAEEALPRLTEGRLALLAHPGAGIPCPLGIGQPLILAVGPEGGWVEAEVGSFLEAGFCGVDLGPRILRVETAVAVLLGRIRA